MNAEFITYLHHLHCLSQSRRRINHTTFTIILFAFILKEGYKKGAMCSIKPGHHWCDHVARGVAGMPPLIPLCKYLGRFPSNLLMVWVSPVHPT